jgi:hypothetical protein
MIAKAELGAGLDAQPAYTPRVDGDMTPDE